MSRSIWKGPFINFDKFKLVIKKKNKQKIKKVKQIFLKTFSRSSTILPVLVNRLIAVYNGRRFIKMLITNDMVGCKLGEFSLTRRFFKFTKKDKKNKNSKKATSDKPKEKKNISSSGKPVLAKSSTTKSKNATGSSNKKK